VARSGEAMDEVMRADGIDAQPRRQARRVGRCRGHSPRSAASHRAAPASRRSSSPCSTRSRSAAPDTRPGGSLAARLGIDAVSAHHLIHRLAAAGHVERRINPQDRRARALRLSARGQALRDRLRAAAQASQERILAPLAPTERTLFLDLLTRLVEVHEAYARPATVAGARLAP